MNSDRRPPHRTPNGPAHPPAPAPKGHSFAFLPLLVMPFVMAGCLNHGATLGEPVATNEVRIGGPWVFEPAWITIEQNTTVNWTNNGEAYHTVTFEALDFNVVIKPGENATYLFDQPGTYEYVCEYHLPHMAGRVTVNDVPVEANATTSRL